MNNKIQIFNFNNKEVRTLLIEGEPYFVWKDVAGILGYKRPNKAIKDHVHPKHYKTLSYKAYSKTGEALWNGNDFSDKKIITEAGVYELILKSHVPQAEKFQDWVTEEVLPTIRKEGAYLTDKKAIDVLNGEGLADILALASKKLKEKEAIIAEQNGKIVLLEEENKTKTQQINEMTPKVSYYDEILANKELLSISVIAKDYGMSAKKMNDLLHQLKVQYKQGRVWLLYTKYQKEGYTKTFTKRNHDTQFTFTKRTQKGRLFLYELLKENGYLPLIEQIDDDFEK